MPERHVQDQPEGAAVAFAPAHARFGRGSRVVDPKGSKERIPMQKNKLFMGGLAWATTEDSL
ncbi:MAG TPA: hypothetical protein PK313_09465, partial [Myxococcota bacterium]|nr:hypothetical protein [Myxococcota bacterium]